MLWRTAWSPALNRVLRLCLASLALIGLDWPACGAERSVVVMLFDGFAPAYFERYPTPAFDQMRAQGAWTNRMEPAFPTLSLTNGVTISTGCWPEHHGIVSNLFLDPERGRYDHSSDADWLTGCEHLHQAAERQGVPSAVLGWYGRYSSQRGALASIGPPGERLFANFPDDSVRTAQLCELIARPPGERPRLILAYFKGPDGAGHFSGLDSEETRAAVIAADAALAKVLEAMDAQPDAEDLQLLVTTDHGMVGVEQVVNIARILRRHGIPARPVSSGTSSFLYFEDGDPAAIDAGFRALATYDEFDVWRRESQPTDWHLGTGPRLGDLIVSAHPPYFIEDIGGWPWFLRWLGFVGPDFLDSSGSVKATHGYPVSVAGVEGVLYTRGSAFAVDREVERVRAIDIHPTVMHILGLEPGLPVDGRVERSLLRAAESPPER
jgi:predicted AlkP superfamily pyrophosphatase or phosphodiesterase